MSEIPRIREGHRRIFLDAYPEPPWVCYFCDEPVDHSERDATGLVVHHLDHNHDNNEFENLVSAHNNCHASYHTSQNRVGSKHSEETKARIAASHRGKVFSEEHRANIGKATSSRPGGMTGKHHTEETKAKIRATRLERGYGTKK